MSYVGGGGAARLPERGAGNVAAAVGMHLAPHGDGAADSTTTLQAERHEEATPSTTIPNAPAVASVAGSSSPSSAASSSSFSSTLRLLRPFPPAAGGALYHQRRHWHYSVAGSTPLWLYQQLEARRRLHSRLSAAPASSFVTAVPAPDDEEEENMITVAEWLKWYLAAHPKELKQALTILKAATVFGGTVLWFRYCPPTELELPSLELISPSAILPSLQQSIF